MSGMTISITDLFSLRDAVGTCLGDLGDRYDNMLVLTADVDVSSRIGVFREKYPDRCYNVGIAEQSLSVGALPLPGAVGVGEGGFLAVFRMLFPSQLLGGAMLLSRGISFYLFVLLTGAALLCRWVWERRPRRMPAA